MSNNYHEQFKSEQASGWHQPSEEKIRQIAPSYDEQQKIREAARQVWGSNN